MPHVFGRVASPDHPLHPKLAAYEGTASHDGLVAETWRYDWRVSPSREGVAVGHLCGPGSEADLRASYRRYHGACICRGEPCEYCHPCNHGSRVADMSRRTRLCRVACPCATGSRGWRCAVIEAGLIASAFHLRLPQSVHFGMPIQCLLSVTNEPLPPARQSGDCLQTSYPARRRARDSKNL